jgi:hypothetical protein
MKTEEGRLKDKIKKHLTALGAYRFMPVQFGYGTQSVDFLCCVKGRFLAIETKAEGKEPTPRQAQCLAEIKQAGGVAFWVDSFESYLLNLAAWGFIVER